MKGLRLSRRLERVLDGGNCRRGIVPVRGCGTALAAPARTASASGVGNGTLLRFRRRLARCNARIAPSKVMPRLLSTCAAALLPSPTMAASTMAPLISRRRRPRAAAAAARECDADPGPRRDRMSAIRAVRSWPMPATSATSSQPSTLLASNTSTASGSSAEREEHGARASLRGAPVPRIVRRPATAMRRGGRHGDATEALGHHERASPGWRSRHRRNSGTWHGRLDSAAFDPA